MLVTSFAAPAFGTNCWILATGAGEECIVIDPGMPDVTPQIEQVTARFGLKPIAALITHGHLDHTFSNFPLCEGYGIPAYIHYEDRELLTHPAKALSPQFSESVKDMEFFEPTDLRIIKSGENLSIAGLDFRAIHAPGHTRGSMIFLFGEEILVSGDVLFAGSIGRTDLPSGSAEDMEKTLEKRILPLPDAMRVLPGHGRESTIGQERMTNPYLQKYIKPGQKRSGKF